MTTEKIARKDLLSLRSPSPGAPQPGMLQLNANEAAEPLPSGDQQSTLNRYPELEARQLQNRMADLYEVNAENLLVTRGSSDAIDLLVRSFCRAGHDSVLTTPPTFELYRYFAHIQGVTQIDVPLLRKNAFELKPDEVIAACNNNTKLIFLCSPNNPTGTIIERADVLSIAAARHGKSIVAVDEAYIEYADCASLAADAATLDNLVVLRTLSKAHALAGARCGAAIGAKGTVNVLRKILPPFALPTPVIECAMAALSTNQIDASKKLVNKTIAERERVSQQIVNLANVVEVWPSQANFLLVQVIALAEFQAHLHEQKILIRGLAEQVGLESCARITIGTQAENDALIKAFSSFSG